MTLTQGRNVHKTQILILTSPNAILHATSVGLSSRLHWSNSVTPTSLILKQTTFSYLFVVTCCRTRRVFESLILSAIRFTADVRGWALRFTLGSCNHHNESMVLVMGVWWIVSHSGITAQISKDYSRGLPSPYEQDLFGYYPCFLSWWRILFGDVSFCKGGILCCKWCFRAFFLLGWGVMYSLVTSLQKRRLMKTDRTQWVLAWWASREDQWWLLYNQLTWCYMPGVQLFSVGYRFKLLLRVG